MSSKKQVSAISARILFSYLSILIIPLCAIIIIYNIASHTILDSQIEKTQLSLNQASSNISSSLGELHHLAMYISYDYNVNSFINTPEKRGRVNVLTLHRMVNALPDIRLTNGNVLDFYIFFNEVDYAVSPPRRSAFPLSPYNYSTNIQFPGTSYEQIMGLTQKIYNGEVEIFRDDTGESLLLLFSIPATGITSRGTIVFNLSMDYLFTPLKSVNPGVLGGAIVLDKEGKLIFSTSHVTPDDIAKISSVEKSAVVSFEEKNYVITTTSTGNGWKYISFSSKQELLAEVAFIGYIMLVLGIFAAVAGFLICLYFWKLRKESYLTASNIADSYGINLSNAKTERTFISQTLLSFWDTVGVLHSTVQEQGELLIAATLRNILSGEYADEAQLLTEIENLGMDVHSEFYFLLHVNLPADTVLAERHLDRTVYRVFIKEKLREFATGRIFFSGLDDYSFVLLALPTAMLSESEVKDKFSHLHQQLMAQDDVAPDFILTPMISSLAEIPDQFSQARNIHFYIQYLNQSGVFTTWEIEEKTDLFYYPVSEEIRLIQLLKKGNPQDLTRFLDEIARENMEKRKLTSSMIISFHSAMRHTILRALRESTESEETLAQASKVQHAVTLQEITHAAMETNRILATHYAMEQDQETLLFKSKLADIVEKEYTSPNFTLHQVAMATGKSENMLYESFKKCFGMTFTDYLEKIRIEKACQLLANKVTISDVATQVGYASDHSFRRAFKRTCGILPSQYAEQQPSSETSPNEPT